MSRSLTKKVHGLEWKLAAWGWAFVIPGIVFFAIFSFYPIINAFILSFHRKNMISPLAPVFVGLSNYKTVLNSPDFWNSVRATLIFAAGSFVPLLIISLVLASFIISANRKSRVWQLIYYSPAILSSSVAALIWMIIFQPTGIANQFMNMILNTDGCIQAASFLNTRIFGYIVEAISLTAGIFLYAPEKVRALSIQNNELIEDLGDPLPQEAGISYDMMLEDGPMRISRRMGFSDSLFAHPVSQILIVGMEDPVRKAAVSAGTSTYVTGMVNRPGVKKVVQKPMEHLEKPWWKLW